MKQFLISLFVLSMALFAGCGDGDDIMIDQTSLSKSLIDSEKEGGTFDVILDSGVAWEISKSLPSWIHVNPMSGSKTCILTITIDENKTAEERKGVVQVKSKTNLAFLAVRQKGNLNNETQTDSQKKK